MRNIMLEQLYTGNIGAAHKPPYETEHSKHYKEVAHRLEQQLKDLLDPYGQSLLVELQETENAVGHAHVMGSFIRGFKLAVLIMVEVFADKESELLDKDYYWLSRTPPKPPSDTDDVTK